MFFVDEDIWLGGEMHVCSGWEVVVKARYANDRMNDSCHALYIYDARKTLYTSYARG